MEETRQYPAVITQSSYVQALIEADRQEIARVPKAVGPQDVANWCGSAPNVVSGVWVSARNGAATSQHCEFALQAYEDAPLFGNLASRDNGIAPSWGEAGNDHVEPCTKRGRQQQWYKDFWPLHSQRFWRLWLYRAARTVVHFWSLQIRPGFKRRRLSAHLTSQNRRGWAAGPARHTSKPAGDV